MIRLTRTQFEELEPIIQAIVEHEIGDYDPPGPTLTDNFARRQIANMLTSKAMNYLEPHIEIAEDD